MKRLLLLIALFASVLIAETRAYTSYLDRRLLSFFPGGGIYKERIQVFIDSDDTRIHSFKVTVSYTDSDGGKQVKTQTIDRWVGEIPLPSLAMFYASGATNIKLESVIPLAVSSDPVVLQQVQ